jgi:hypothetical protein
LGILLPNGVSSENIKDNMLIRLGESNLAARNPYTVIYPNTDIQNAIEL